MNRLHALLALAVMLACGAAPTLAQEFAVSASPPRFELRAKPGETVRDVVELENSSQFAGLYTVATADWTLAADGGVTFFPALQPDSCRPWVALERSTLELPSKRRFRFRFEVTPPPGQPAGECRFAILISGADLRVAPNRNMAFPVAGQIALIVYVAVGDIKPDIQVVEAGVATVGGSLVPTIKVRNNGTAHGRLSGQLSGIDAKGKRRDFTPSTLPILAGETRTIPLNVDLGDPAAPPAGDNPVVVKPKIDAIAYPLRITGTISDTVKTVRFSGTFAP